MGNINFALVIHNHQPVDNDGAIIEAVYRKAYLPFLRTLHDFPDIAVNMHYSGYLLEWIESHHPEFVDMLRSMVARGQVEMLGGGYYEPVLACIPDEDAKGQVALLREKIERLLGSKVNGFWTAERAWEPQMPEMLQASGVKHTFLDDTIFTLSGLRERDCFRPYLVESRGAPVTVFPISKRLRYLIPWKGYRSAISLLRKEAEGAGGGIAVFGDDGEKFGAWPTTYELVYERGWLRKFFEGLVANRRWLRPVKISDFLSQHPAHSAVHLPAASYDEMMEWAVFDGQSGEEHGRVTQKPRGFWRVFLSKYPEGGRMYAKMLRVSRMVHLVEDWDSGEAIRELWKGQCNDAYWHGVFGGLYSSALRRITYHHIVMAQRMAERSAQHEDKWLTVGEASFRGYRELDIDTESLGLRLCPQTGGSVAELDLKEPAINLLDTLPRRREAYHEDIRRRVTRQGRKRRRAGAKVRSIHDAAVALEEGLSELLAYDRYQKLSFQDFLVREDTEIDDFVDQTFTEVARTVDRPYQVTVVRKERGGGPGGASFLLLRRPEPGDLLRATLRKRLEVPATGSGIAMRYQVETERGKGMMMMTPEEARLAIEISLGSLGDRAFIRKHMRPSVHHMVSGEVLDYPEMGLRVSLSFSSKVDVWQVPIRTVSRSESGYESNLQGVSLIPNLPVAESLDGLEISLSASRQGGSQKQR